MKMMCNYGRYEDKYGKYIFKGECTCENPL